MITSLITCISAFLFGRRSSDRLYKVRPAAEEVSLRENEKSSRLNHVHKRDDISKRYDDGIWDFLLYQEFHDKENKQFTPTCSSDIYKFVNSEEKKLIFK